MALHKDVCFTFKSRYLYTVQVTKYILYIALQVVRTPRHIYVSKRSQPGALSIERDIYAQTDMNMKCGVTFSPFYLLLCSYTAGASHNCKVCTRGKFTQMLRMSQGTFSKATSEDQVDHVSKKQT